MRRLLERVTRGIYRSLIPQPVQNELRARLLFVERDKPPRAIVEFDAGPVLVLSPHMDDEVLGCGGTLRRHVLAGAPVTVVFLTDGALGNARRERLPEVAETRRAEARAAAELLGTTESIELGRPDGALEPDEALAAELAAICERVRPAVVYLPSILDAHADHFATGRAFADALERAGGWPTSGVRLRQYEVWSPLAANALVDVGPTFDDKLRALRCYASQTALVDFERTATGLADYRSSQLDGGRGRAEAFFDSSVPEYQELLRRYGDDV